jgi:hypothetical protein
MILGLSIPDSDCTCSRVGFILGGILSMCARLLPLLKLLLLIIFDFEVCGGQLRLMLGYEVSLLLEESLNTLIKS